VADSQEPENPTPSEEDVQKAFWDEMDKRMDSRFEKFRESITGILKPSDPKPEPDKGDKKDQKPEPGTSRTGGPRVTLSSLIADAVFGPKKD